MQFLITFIHARHRRLDIAGPIHHVIVRGIERRKLFRDDVDREEFLRCLENILGKTKCTCYAWVLMRVSIPT